MNYNEIVSRVSEKTNLSGRVVDKIFKAYWLSIKAAIQTLPFKEDLSEDDFFELRTNFNIPSLGKLTCTYDKYTKQKKRHEHIITFRDRNVKAKKD